MSTLLVENIRHEDATSPAITLDANGNVGINTTDTNPVTNNVAGTSILSGGGTRVSRSGEPGGYNRIGSDGTLINFRKDGTTVGKIGTVSGKLVLGGGSSAGSDLTIDDSGNIGIGDTTPSHTLTIGGGHIVLKQDTAATDGTGDIQRQSIGWHTAGSEGVIGAYITSETQGSWGGDLRFNTRRLVGGSSATRMIVSDGGDIKIINPEASPVNGVNLPGALIFEGNGWNTAEGSRPLQGQIHLWGGYNNPTGGSVEPALVFSLKGTGNGSFSTADGPDVLTERMRLDNYGNLTLDGNFISSGNVIASGTVLQVQSTTLTGPASYTGNSNPDGTGANLGLNVSITPKSSNSAFYVMCSIGVGSTTSGNTWAILLIRDNARVNAGMGAAAASHLGGIWFKSVDHAGNNGTDTNHGVGATGVYLDNNSSTAGVATTFSARGVAEGGSGHINYVESDYTGTGAGPVSSRTQSTITVWEIEK